MARLEDLTTGTLVKGIIPDATAELLSVKWHGSDVLRVARDFGCRLFRVAEKIHSQDDQAWNAPALAWTDLVKLARKPTAPHGPSVQDLNL